MGEKISVRKWMGSVEVSPPVLRDGRGRFIVLGSVDSEVGGPIIYEQEGKVFMRIGDGYDSDTLVDLPVGAKIISGCPVPHVRTEIEVVDDDNGIT